MSADPIHDLAVIGGGPAGRMAALKSALLFHTAVLVDKGPRTSRAFFVPNMDNIPGYPQGVSGRKLMDDLAAQIRHAEEVGGRKFVTFEDRTEITRLSRGDDGIFVLVGHRVEGRDAVGEAVVLRARAVVLATGVVDRQPYIGEEGASAYDIRAVLPYANKGLADYCLLCDGHTVRDQRVAVIGIGRGSLGIARSLRDHFGARETVLVTCVECATGERTHDHEAHETLLREAAEAGVPTIDKVVVGLEGIREDRIRLAFADGTSETFDKAWISFAWYRINNALALQMGAALDDDGFVRTTEDCEVIDAKGEPIAGLFAIGDLRAETWKQVPIALGDAESAVIHAYAVRL